MSLHERYAKQGFLELVDVFTKEEADRIYSGYTDYVERYLCEDPKRDEENIFGKDCLLKSYITDTEVRFGREGRLEGDFR